MPAPKRPRASGVVASKLSPPKPRGDAVERAGLGSLAERFPGCPLVLVRAPAGYGKTSLLAQWRAEEEARGAATSWLTLDSADDDPARLLTHLALAIARGRSDDNLAELQAELQANSNVAGLVDWLELPTGPFTLFLDDCDSVLRTEPIAILRRLAARFAEPARLVIASRSRLSLGVGKKRLLGRLVEIDVGELRFSAEEARSLLGARGVALDPESLASLIARTEGWPAAIELAALALADRADGARFVASFSGSF
jgi:LuxR family maltose regulon positive regulatory protein